MREWCIPRRNPSPALRCGLRMGLAATVIGLSPNPVSKLSENNVVRQSIAKSPDNSACTTRRIRLLSTTACENRKSANKLMQPAQTWPSYWMEGEMEASPSFMASPFFFTYLSSFSPIKNQHQHQQPETGLEAWQRQAASQTQLNFNTTDTPIHIYTIYTAKYANERNKNVLAHSWLPFNLPTDYQVDCVLTVVSKYRFLSTRPWGSKQASVQSPTWRPFPFFFFIAKTISSYTRPLLVTGK